MSTAKSFDSDELYNSCNPDPKVVSCFCGSTQFTIFNGRIRMARECACIYCYQHAKWANSLGGPEVPPILSGGYWDNDLRVEKGEENMIVVLLKESGKSKRVVSRCCYSTLMIDHPAYNRIGFALFENACKIPWDNEIDPPSVTRPPSDRIFMKYWHKSRGVLPEFIGDPLRIDQENTLPYTQNNNRQSIDNPMGETCQSLFSRLPWYTLEIDEGVIPKNKEDWPDLKPIEPR